MKTLNGYKGVARALSISLLAACSAGCGIETASEDELTDVGVSEEAMGEASCAIANPSGTYEGVGLFGYSSPRNYSNPNCYKAVVLDIVNMVVGEPSNTIFARYWDDVPATQLECEKLWMGMYIYAHFDGVWEKVDMGTARGRWETAHSPARCVVPHLWLSDGLVAEGTDGDNAYRVVIGARTDNTSSAPTRKFLTYETSR